MLSTPSPFPAGYDARIVDAPGRGEPDVEVTAGQRLTRVLTVEVTTDTGSVWTGAFSVDDPVSRQALTTLVSTPDPNLLCVVHAGVAFTVDVAEPSRHAAVATGGPVVGVVPVAAPPLLLLLTPWTITAVGPGGTAAWQTDRLAVEGIRVDEVGDGWLRGVADERDAEPRDFAVHLESGDVVGGAGIG